jgi:hypothetical protein
VNLSADDVAEIACIALGIVLVTSLGLGLIVRRRRRRRAKRWVIR